jgi:large subunit ribosomal protein L9
MKVILQESYMNLGEAGDVVDVKPGYARNFLLPQKLAVSATQANVKRFEDKAKELQTKKERERENSKRTLGLLENLSVTLKKKVSEEGKLFGAVTTKELEAEFQKLGAAIDRRMIVLGRQIKMAGDYTILVKLVGGLKANVPLKVVSDAPPKEGQQQAYTVESATPAKQGDEEAEA